MISMMIYMKVLVVLFLSGAAIVIGLDPASFLEVNLLLPQRLFFHYHLLKRMKTFSPLHLRKTSI